MTSSEGITSMYSYKLHSVLNETVGCGSRRSSTEDLPSRAAKAKNKEDTEDWDTSA